jgi:hypothetical protein
MARVMGSPGRYARQQMSKQRIALGIVLCICEFLSGALFAWGFVVSGSLIAAIVTLLIALLGVWGFKYLIKKMEHDEQAWEKGFDGEVMVGKELAGELPNSFSVIHDLATEYGNLDHVVIGPTGVFAVETKNWRGTVTADGNNELLLNGKPPDKPVIRQFTRSIMRIRERLIPLVMTEPFIKGVMVFPIAYKDAPWGKTGNVHCISIDQIPSYFLSQKQGKQLTPDEVTRTARGFLALARMEEGFETTSNPKT